ncbi:hypothetical protein V8C35DRAFT_277939 [Trichoderma chlorosporum]
MVSAVPQNTYHAYKRDTQQLLFWIIHAFNSIVAAEPGSDEHQNRQNVTGQATVRELIAMAKTIAQHATLVPGAIYRKLQSVTSARMTVHQAFQQIAAFDKKPDPELEECNASHKFFIDALQEVFEVLGGSDWLKKQQAKTQSQADGGKEAELEAELDADVEMAKFTNRFAVLGLGNPTDGEADAAAVDSGDDEESDAEPKPTSNGHQRRQTRPGRGKKKKGGKRAKKGKQAAKPAHATLDEVPLESYRIIEDADGIITDYLLAVYALFEDICDLRQYMGDVWREVAYEGLNSAVAATLADLSTAIIKRAESAIMVDFPGHESYETVMQTITRGDINKAQENFTMALYRTSAEGAPAEKIQEVKLDVEEQFLIYAYSDLVDFVTDFQATRSGKPTKRMLQEIDKWDPNLDLRRATKEQRHRWRRCYTINWLYDLVNVYSSIVVQRNTMKGEHHVYEKVDWSADGQWSEHVRLFGINEFAGIVTSLAMQKPGTNVKKSISPSLVFQLQCIVDSLMVSRGWSHSALKGHVLEPASKGFRPRRDVDLFLDRDSKRFGKGLLQGISVLKQLLERDNMLGGNPDHHQGLIEVLDSLMWNFQNWLGESKYEYGLDTLPPSRFSNSNANGLWEYSPFLCGTGLAESLEIVYGVALAFWERMPEPMHIVHLHNMLVQRKYLDRPIGLFAALEETFPTAFFADGRPPTSNFSQAVSSQVSKSGAARRQRAIRRTAPHTGQHRLLDPATNRFFRIKSNLSLYRESGWNCDRILDEDLGKHTLLLNFRSNDSNALASRQGADEPRPLILNNGLPVATRPSRLDPLSRRDMLDLIRWDVYSDICGPIPYSSLNYFWVTARIMSLFMTFEVELEKVDNPTYRSIYVTNSGQISEKRVILAVAALSGDDEECLRIMARIMEEQRGGWMQHIYWDDLDSSLDRLRQHASHRNDTTEPSRCTVM